jgi:hypothetical protein
MLRALAKLKNGPEARPGSMPALIKTFRAERLPAYAEVTRYDYGLMLDKIEEAMRDMAVGAMRTTDPQQPVGHLQSRRIWLVGDRGEDSETREQCATVHHSINSACTRSDCGIVRPSALAVLMLMTSSNFVGCRTGRSAGLAPLRILPV